MENVVITAGVRTAIGTFGGSLKDFTPTEMARLVILEVMKRSGITGDMLSEVIFGQVIPRTDENNLVPRGAALAAGIPNTVPAHTTIRGCGSGMESITSGCRRIMLGEGDIILAGGVESMSTCPYICREVRFGARMQDVRFIDSLWEVLIDPHTQLIMGLTAENIAERWKISREDQDLWAYTSNQRALKAIADGKLKPQILPVEVKQRKSSFIFDTDEHPKNTPLEKLSQLRPAYKSVEDGGTVTAGSASGINDAASAVVIMSESRAKAEGIEPLARIIKFATAACPPEIMGYAPVPASKKVLEQAGMTVDDIDVWEINEAFAAQLLCCQRELGIDPEKLNIWGGAIAYGHPVGASGTRITHSIIDTLRDEDKTIGLATMCIGGGQSIAMILERLK